MSLMTSGVKILDEPRTYLRVSAGSRASAASPVEVRASSRFSASGRAKRALREPTGFRGLFWGFLGIEDLRRWTIWRGASGGRSTPSTFLQVSEHELLLVGLEIVVVPQLLAGDDLLEVIDAFAGIEIVHLELARQPFAVAAGEGGRHGVDAQAPRLAAEIDGAVIHRVAEVLAGVAADDHAPTL